MILRPPRSTLFPYTPLLRCGVRPHWTWHPLTTRYFNPRTPVGCDPTGDGTDVSVSLFQSTHPSGVRPSESNKRSLQSNFNPRTPVGCDPSMTIDATMSAKFQSTHPSGVRRPHSRALPRPTHFNPRTPVGCDMKNLNNDPSRNVFQSTHPSGVRPSARRPVVCIHRKFQSTHPSGVRPFITPLRASFWLFQSTHPSGVRQAQNRGHAATDNFNPRTPVGCDSSHAPQFHRLVISIHAPQWGATNRLSSGGGAGAISIHAPQWGATTPLDAAALAK